MTDIIAAFFAGVALCQLVSWLFQRDFWLSPRARERRAHERWLRQLARDARRSRNGSAR